MKFQFLDIIAIGKAIEGVYDDFIRRNKRERVSKYKISQQVQSK